jgi:hypothetical protein
MLEIIQLAIRKESIDKGINALKKTVKRSREQFTKQIVIYDICREQMKDKSYSHHCVLSAEPPFKEVI